MPTRKKAKIKPMAEEDNLEFQARCDNHDWDSHWWPSEDEANNEASTVHTKKTGHTEFTMVQKQSKMSLHGKFRTN